MVRAIPRVGDPPAPGVHGGALRYSTTSEGPGVLPILTSHHALRISRALSAYPLFPLCLQNTSTIRDRQRDPCDALIYFLRFLRFLRNDQSLKTTDGGSWSRPRTTTCKARVAIGFPPLLHSTAHTRASSPRYLLLWEERPVCRGSCNSSPESKNRVCAHSRLMQLRKKRKKRSKTSA